MPLTYNFCWPKIESEDCTTYARLFFMHVICATKHMVYASKQKRTAYFDCVCVMASKRVDLCVADKVWVLEALREPGAKQVQVAEKFGVSKSVVSRILKNSDAILKKYDISRNRGRKRQRDGKEADVGEALWLWFQHKLSQGACLSRPMLKQKATHLAAEQGKEFNPSDGWLSRWKARHNIVQRKEYGEKQDADLPAAAEWKAETLPSILDEFKPRDIFNADETGLFYRGFSDRGLDMLREQFAGGKKAMDRITLLCCANMDGTEKRSLMVIGKSKSPCCFPKDHSKLPVIYRNSAKAWMTSSFFQEWLKNWERELRLQNRHVCLLIDNCLAHSVNVNLSHVVLKFLPPNTTLVMQPMDMGVIKNFKGHYRTHLNARIIASLDADPQLRAVDVAKKTTLLDAIHLTKESWAAVLPQTVCNFFRKGGFVSTGDNAGVVDIDDIDVLADVIPDNMTAEEFEAVVEVDSQLETADELTDAELLETVAAAKHPQVEEPQEDSASDDEPKEPSLQEQLHTVDIFQRICQHHGFEIGYQAAHKIEMDLHIEAANCKKQTTLDNYFN
ncbi:tigger transposable element-derived protein 4-like [Latimeria chalumnae]|uniref:tigger transposable element-derived protein 4-like n=1 Tax=Latimeria chalumnae TaxID=7897 RepID=UPI00313B3AC5